MRARTTLAAALTGALVLWATRATAAPITFVTALPVAKDQFVVRMQANPLVGSFNSATTDKQLYDLAFPQVIAYGPNSEWTVFLTVTPDLIQYRQTVRGVHSAASASGFADTLIWFRYTLFRKDWLKMTLREAPIVGIYLPSGWYNKMNASGPLPQDMQNGSGQVAGYFADAVTWKDLNQELDWDFQYRLNGAASPGYTRGDSWRTDGSWQIRLWPWPYPETGIPNYVYLALETNALWNDRNVVGGTFDPDTGGFAWYFDPGMYYASLRWDSGVAAQVPILQNLPGTERIAVNFRIFAYFEYYFHVPSLLSD